MKTFLITGSSRGIGLATAHRLKESGYQVVGIARKRPATDFPGILYCADLSHVDETTAVLSQIKSKHVIDGIINNIGDVQKALLEDTTMKSFFEVIDLNLRPAIQAVQTFLPDMKERGWGRIVNIASRALLGKVGCSSYSAAKASLVALARTWALEFAPYHITVNVVAPGPIQTEAFLYNYPKGSVESEQLIAALPLKRIGLPEEVAHAIAFFLDERASFITGQTLFVDGGGSVGVAQ